MSTETLHGVASLSENTDTLSVFILAGGRGTRLRSGILSKEIGTTKLLTKINIGNETLPMITLTLEGILNAFSPSQLSSVVILTADHPESDPAGVERYASEYLSRRDVYCETVREPRPLGTAGAIFNALNVYKCNGPVIICPGDVMYPYQNLRELLHAHQTTRPEITWAVTSNAGEGAQNSGKLWVDKITQQLVHSYESVDNDQIPSPAENIRKVTSVGVLVIDADKYYQSFPSFSQTTSNPTPDVYRAYIPWSLDQGQKVSTFDIYQPAPDLGTPDRFLQFGWNVSLVVNAKI